MDIDWAKFGTRVPTGTRIIGEGGEGVLLENYPYSERDFVGHGDSQWLRVQLFTDYFGSGMHYCLRGVQSLRYLISGAWTSYDQVMSDAS